MHLTLPLISKPTKSSTAASQCQVFHEIVITAIVCVRLGQ